MEQKKLKMNNQKFCRILSFVVALLIIINVALMIASNMLASTLDTYLGKGHLVKESPNGTESWDTSYYDVKYQNNKESTEAAYEVAAQVMQEGTVLLKNNGILPLADGSTVTPFGRAYLDPIYGQLTSGGSAKWVVDPVSPEQALSSVYTLNNAAVDKMKASPDPKALTEAEGTFSAGESGSLLGGNSFLYEYAPSIYDGMDDVSGTTGIVFITRAGQEGSDKKYDAYTDGTPHYLALSSNEKEAIKIAKEKCGSVIVVLVSSAPMELTPIQSGEYEADAILWVGHPGERGFAELAGIMDGSTVPSGRTVDIYPSDFTKDPSYQNIGSFSYDNAPVMIEGFSSGNAQESSRYFTDYQEGVYVGYRYYETADVMDDDFVYGELDENGGVVTAGAVCYPFGYGLSYTTFEQSITGYHDSGDTISVDVTVTNTGSVYSGKDVVQLYYNAPYTDLDIENKVEKPVANLIAFDKTKELAPGESQTLTLSFAKEDMASYCYTHANPDGTIGCYMLEAGDYEITLRNNSHDVLDTRITTLNDTTWYDGSDDAHIRNRDKDAQSTLDNDGNPTGEAMEGEFIAATNQFQTSSDYMNSNSIILSRADWAGTQPKMAEGRTKSLNAEFIDKLGKDITFEVETDPVFGNVEGSLVYHEDQPTSNQKNGLTLSSMRGLDYNDPKWESYLDQIDWEGDKDSILLNHTGAAYTLGAISSLGIPSTVQEDGANGLKVQGSDNGYDMSKSSSFPFAPVIAATWNVDLLYNVGAAFGQESLQNGVNGWYCPAINLHRSPFSGRVFEYYSEDPILSGKLAAACISGAGDQGMVCYLKHFALNDTETNRNQLCTTWATEQTMRDIYMKAFEIAVEEARMTVKYTADENGTTATRVMRATTGIMPAQNSVGDCLGTCNYNLLNNVLRKEWGFRGMVITDYWIWGDNNLRDLCIRTGSDAYLCMSMPAMWNLNDYDSATARWAMRNAIHNISYALANSNATQDSAPGTTFRMSISPWKIAANAAIVVIWVLVVALIVLMVRRTKDAKLHPENYKPRKQKKVKA